MQAGASGIALIVDRRQGGRDSLAGDCASLEVPACGMRQRDSPKPESSNTPGGPLKTMVLASPMTLANASMLSGPMSRPFQPAGMSVSLL